MSAKNNPPLPQPKPYIRTSREIMEQAQAMMTPQVEEQPTPPEDDPE